ncbi:ABC transporter permease [Amycolatopsis pithecellobii]|uniref:ABC transporter permease subunit n=1 Tax=Amycolatopsis pithecellobii TaxID=664692 RepID=A0A6N7Z000_9PSEU|nr:ABC transporter permease subunit [Amycolatopsis pithecellobii]MTD57578.1 ABC transporter permease subunit [Amycolatopsis pithecellobii]
MAATKVVDQSTVDLAGQRAGDVRRQRLSTRSRSVRIATQVLVAAAVLLAWQYLPQIGNLSEWRFLDPYFISSPELVYDSLVKLLLGRSGVPAVWPFLWPTFLASLIGLVIAMVAGGLFGLLLGSFEFAGAVFRPFVVALNAVPRIALIPIVVVLFGSGLASSIVVAFLVVFFVALFNAYEGARTVEVHVRHNARLLGASGWNIMWRVRFPYALAWTLSSLPVAVSFAIVSVVTGEILTGGAGMGLLITTATNASNTSMTFAVIIVLSVCALAMLRVADEFKRRVLHWWIQAE